MEIKYTIEILTKDIQDIEKLVGNLQNSTASSAIELDLALSKLRNVYEILTMIKADKLNELINTPVAVSPEPQKEEHLTPEPQAAVKPEAQKEVKVAPEPQATVNPEPQEEVQVAPEPQAEAKPEPQAAAPDPAILGEKFPVESSINENLAEKQGGQMDAKFVGQAIDNISRNIGINDRFLIIRELFEGDSDGFSKLLGQLDAAENYQSAAALMEERFSGSAEHEGVEILAGLVKRRYIH